MWVLTKKINTYRLTFHWTNKKIQSQYLSIFRFVPSASFFGSPCMQIYINFGQRLRFFFLINWTGVLISITVNSNGSSLYNISLKKKKSCVEKDPRIDISNHFFLFLMWFVGIIIHSKIFEVYIIYTGLLTKNKKTVRSIDRFFLGLTLYSSFIYF